MKSHIKFLIAVCLLIVGYLLLYCLTIPSLAVGTVVSLSKGKAGKYYMDLAIAIDQLGNVLCQHLFNLTLIKSNGYKFGHPDETISSVLGKNHRTATLSNTGLQLSRLLNALDSNHVQESIDETIKSPQI